MVTAEQKRKNVSAFEAVVKVVAADKQPVAPLTDWYSLAPIEPTGGGWYFCADCPSCQRLSPLFFDYSDGELGNPFASFGFRAICYFCGANYQCPSERLQSIRWPVAPGEKPVISEYSMRVARKYIDDPEYKPIGLLHHYTSVDALLSIMRSKSLWASNIRYLNDSSESELGLALMKEVTEEARKAAAGVDGEILSFVSDWLDRRVEGAGVYVLSFSTAHDQLSQWRGYTRYGEGVCISIDSGFLVECMQAQGWAFQNCRYQRASQLTWAEAILSRIRREAATQLADGIETKAGIAAVLHSCLTDLLQVAATIKHPAYEQEHEVRFISPMIDLEDPRVGYRACQTGRIPYVEVKLEEGPQNFALSQIMVGPGPAQGSVQSSIVEALNAAGIQSCPVRLCTIPYREL